MKWFMLLVINTVPVVCLTFLALHFGKWWIVLFAPLFAFTYETGKEDAKDENT